MSRKPSAVYGHTITPPHITRGGVWMALTRIGMPFIVLLMGIDFVIWAIARAFGACYGVWCWL